LLRTEGDTFRAYRNGEPVLEYDAEVIEAALLSKHSQTAFLDLATARDDAGRETCSVTSVTYCKHASILRLRKLVEAGDAYLDLTLSQPPDGKLKDHGFLWRLRTEAIERLYLESRRDSRA